RAPSFPIAPPQARQPLSLFQNAARPQPSANTPSAKSSYLSSSLLSDWIASCARDKTPAWKSSSPIFEQNSKSASSGSISGKTFEDTHLSTSPRQLPPKASSKSTGYPACSPSFRRASMAACVRQAHTGTAMDENRTSLGRAFG